MIMAILYDEEEVMRSYVESERYDEKIEIAKRFLRMNKLSYEEIAAGSELRNCRKITYAFCLE